MISKRRENEAIELARGRGISHELFVTLLPLVVNPNKTSALDIVEQMIIIRKKQKHKQRKSSNDLNY